MALYLHSTRVIYSYLIQFISHKSSSTTTYGIVFKLEAFTPENRSWGTHHPKKKNSLNDLLFLKMFWHKQ